MNYNADVVADAVDDAVGDAGHDAVGDAVDDAVGNAVDDAVNDAVDDAVGDAVGNAVAVALRKQQKQQQTVATDCNSISKSSAAVAANLGQSPLGLTYCVIVAVICSCLLVHCHSNINEPREETAIPASATARAARQKQQ